MDENQQEMTWTIRRYVCARCWSHLLIVKEPGQPERVECSNRAHCDGKGYVTRRYAERRREESIGELMQVKNIYPDLFRSKRKEADLMTSLGF